MRWDVFISHANEDKDIARTIAISLSEAGLKVWFDEFVLSPGDNLRRCIDQGLIESRFGIVILSKNFFGKHWTQSELDGLASLEVDGSKKIIPVWHNIEFQEIVKISPSLAMKLAIKTTDGFDNLINKIVELFKFSEVNSIGEMFLPAFTEAQKRWDELKFKAVHEDTHFFVRKKDCLMRIQKTKGINLSPKPIEFFSHKASGDSTIDKNQLQSTYLDLKYAKRSEKNLNDSQIISNDIEGRNFLLKMPLLKSVKQNSLLHVEHTWTWPGTFQRPIDYIFGAALYSGGTEDFDLFVTFVDWLPVEVNTYKLEKGSTNFSLIASLDPLPKDIHIDIVKEKLRIYKKKEVVSKLISNSKTYHFKQKQIYTPTLYLIYFIRRKLEEVRN